MKWLKLNGNGGLINLEEVFFVRVMRNQVFYVCKSRTSIKCLIASQKLRLVGKVVTETFLTNDEAQSRLQDVEKMLDAVTLPPHAHWDNAFNGIQCSACGKFNSTTYRSQYCPHCGAKMKEGKDEQI
nr:MAG TPA: Putative toxin VapC6 domain, ZN ribbon domain [Caudoviricetes sp.]